MHKWVILALTGNQNRIRGGGGGSISSQSGGEIDGDCIHYISSLFFLNLPPSLFPLVVPVYSSDIKILQKKQMLRDRELNPGLPRDKRKF